MGKQKPFSRRDSPEKKIQCWIDDIDDDKLCGAFVEGLPIVSDDYFRLDCQGVTTLSPLRFNLQVQVNYQIPDTSLSRLGNSTVAHALVPVEDMWSPSQIKKTLKSTVTGWRIARPGPDGLLE